MKNKLFYLLFILVGAISSSSFSTEYNPSATQRERILSRLNGESCKESLTRGITRGVTRSATRSVTAPVTRSAMPAFPEKIAAFDKLYADIIRIEMGVPYGFEHDPNSYYFIKKDPYEGAAKLEIYHEFKYRWENGDEPTYSPGWIENARSSQAAVLRRGLDPKKMWRPAIALFRKTGEVTDPKTGKITDKMEYLFVDPLTESFPSDMSSWTVLTKDVQFNIPFNAIFEAFKQGKFPVLDANHDLNHIISGIRFPEFTYAVIEMIQASKPETITLGFKRRQYWLMEALSLPDPQNFKQNQNFLKSQGRSLESKTTKQTEAELSKMKEADLLQYALKQARYLESQLRDVSGGNSNAAEKWYYLSESFGMKAHELINEDFSRADRLFRIKELSKAYFDQGRVTLDANPKLMTNETATFNFNTFVTSQKLLALMLLQDKTGDLPKVGWDRKTAIQNLIMYMSRTEAILRQPPPTYRQWAEAFLQAELPLSNPVAQLLLEVFGNDIVKNIYLGVGIKRTEM